MRAYVTVLSLGMFQISLCVITKSESVPAVFVFHYLVLNFPILSPMLSSKFLLLLGLLLRFGILKLSPLRLGGQLGRRNAPV